MFDELQRLKLALTGKPLGFKKFVRGGNLLVANVDMDPAQVIGLCRSVMKYNDPDYSGIPNDTPPEEIAPLFIKVCWRHAKEYLLSSFLRSTSLTLSKGRSMIFALLSLRSNFGA